ncbi:hypothetical protein E2320_011387 [Naja naja]|nr:hypothetical protein E2320_011387 [Naja naja]
MRWFYERNRWLMFPLCGMFPVKLITHIGKPIPYDPDITPEKLAEKFLNHKSKLNYFSPPPPHSISPHATPLFQQTQRGIEDLRDKHQKIPGSILHALRQRFEAYNKDK